MPTRKIRNKSENKCDAEYFFFTNIFEIVKKCGKIRSRNCNKNKWKSSTAVACKN